ncbi:putative disease resistance protein RGA1 [Oryza glaberrima]|uniref:putative disease resistance protein RGA1 n=1 Tax=Oryza glaberrima TaxID=4538 RepID=UPI00224C1D9A|nr:putative disease resistance protein RGA1 [Oryza glaberrima]XP_052164603.1 putative disease resistance protein RGA1 [Oryza glaberrima]
MGTILVCLSSKCLEKLVGILREEFVKTLFVRRDIRKLRESLKYFDSVCEDADALALENRVTGTWWSDVKDVMYDVDDIVDFLRAHSYKQRSCDCVLFSRLAQLPLDYRIARRIKYVNERLVQITMNSKMFVPLAVRSPQILQRNGVCRYVAASVDELDVVGREIKETTDDMVQMIIGCGHQSTISVYGILGMGGIGKTTLAQKIYNDGRIRERFHHVLIWLSISESISETDLLKEAIEKAGGQSYQGKSKDQLLQALLNCITEQSIFLVLDNMTSSHIWIDLLRSPIERCADAHVLVTTRSRDVLSQMNAIHVHKVHKLKEHDGLELLMKRSFRTEDEINVFGDVGSQIVKKCDGLPLAIKAVAGVLSSKATKEEWARVLESRWCYEGLPEEIQGPLYLSYSDLSPQLKTCFLWCALLPQNFHIHRDVTYYWIAEGFVKKEGSRPIHEVAEDYYHELIMRNLLQARPEYIDKGISTMHDLLRLLGQYLTGDEAMFMDEENDETPPNVWRLAVGNAVEEIPGIQDQKKLRCVLVYYHDACRSVKRDIYRKLEHLRILILVGACLQSIPESVGHLVLLRLLDVSYNEEIKQLPESIGNLTFLEYLSVSGCLKLASLPASLMTLSTISFLSIGGTRLTQVPKGIGNFRRMDNLRSVFQVGTRGFRLDELDSLSKIRRLLLIKLEKASPPASPVLCNKRHLKELGISCTMGEEADCRTSYEDNEVKNIEEIYNKLCPSQNLQYIFIDGFPGGVFPEWLSSEPQDTLPNLAHLHFNHCISCPELPPAGQLPILQVLHVKGADAVVSIGHELFGKGVVSPTHTIIFPKLELLEIVDIYNWQSWSVSTESLSDGMSHPKNPKYINCCLN